MCAFWCKSVYKDCFLTKLSLPGIWVVLWTWGVISPPSAELGRGLVTRLGPAPKADCSMPETPFSDPCCGIGWIEKLSEPLPPFGPDWNSTKYGSALLDSILLTILSLYDASSWDLDDLLTSLGESFSVEIYYFRFIHDFWKLSSKVTKRDWKFWNYFGVLLVILIFTTQVLL